MVREIFNPMVRELRHNEPAIGYGSFETPLRHQDAGAILRGCSFVSALSQGNGRTEARSDPGDNSEPDPFADWQSSAPVVYPDNIDKMDSRTAYLIGRSHGKEQQFENLKPAIDAAIERVSNAYRS